MEGNILTGGLGAALGYAVGKQNASASSSAVPVDVATLRQQLSQLTQQKDLLNAQITALTALRAVDAATGQAAALARQALEAQVTDLNTKLSNVTSQIFTGFPVVLGKGDPTLAGWIKGRDKLLVSRPLANLTPVGMTIGTAINDTYTADGNILTVADITQSIPGRPITIGRNVNTQLQINLPRGCDLNVAIMFGFDEDIADDMDFIGRASIATLHHGIITQIHPIGRNNLLMFVTGASGSYSTWDYTNMIETLKHGHGAEAVSAYVAANKWSVNTSYRSRFHFSHRSARSLTLRSVHLVANPIWAENDTMVNMGSGDLTYLRPTVDSAQLQRLTTGVNPRFLRINDTWNLVAQDVPAAQYL